MENMQVNMAEEVTALSSLSQMINSIPRIIFSHLPWPPPPPLRRLLPVTSADAQSIRGNLRNFELGKLALTLGSAAALGVLSSRSLPAGELGYTAVVGLTVGCAAVWNGILFGKASLEFVGISLVFVCFYGLVASFLPSRFSWACWLAAAVSLVPFLYLLVINPPAPAVGPAVASMTNEPTQPDQVMIISS